LAIFDSIFFTPGTYDAGTGIFTASAASSNAPAETTDNEPVGGGQPGDTTFEVGDNLSVNEIVANPEWSGGGQYVGHIDDGFLAEQGGRFFLFSNTAHTSGQTSQIDTGDFAVCFVAGTLIATPDGERAVEALAIGDLVMTANGRAVPVKWLGRQTLSATARPSCHIRPRTAHRWRAGPRGRAGQRHDHPADAQK
jgi:hypothetical protein